MNRRQRRAHAKARARNIPLVGTSASTDSQLKASVSRHRAGRLAEARRLYAEILSREPKNVVALHLLGVIELQEGNAHQATELIGKAIALQPDYAEAHNNLGNALKGQGRLDDAVAAYHRALASRPDYAEAHNNLGNALKDQGRLDDAVAAYHKALASKPDYAEAHNNLGGALKDQGLLDDAIAAYRKALASRPDYAKAHNNLGTALKDQGRPDDAVAAYHEALKLKPDYAEAHYNLGNALEDRGGLDDAVAAYHRALALKPDFAEAHCNLGNALKDQGRLDDAVAAYHRSLESRPDFVEAHSYLGMALLLLGDYRAGFREYDWRWKSPDTLLRSRNFRQPEWDGGTFPDRTILLHAEQGFGDTIQFVRYARLVRAMGGKVIVECQKPLTRLLGGVSGIDHLVPQGGALPEFDVHAPLLSLPGLLGTTLDALPANVPYLSADRALVEGWRRRVGQDDRLTVGLVWRGRTEHKNDRNRSISLERLLPVLDAPEIRFFSLQVGDASAEIDVLGSPNRIDDLAPELSDFADTAAALTALDLLISVDTAPVHLAGALGRPVWLLLPFAPDWRWLLEREDSPWYPTMRLFRQDGRGAWAAVIDRVREELLALAEGDTSRLEPKAWNGSPTNPNGAA